MDVKCFQVLSIYLGDASQIDAQCLEAFYIHRLVRGAFAGYNNLENVPDQSRKLWAMRRMKHLMAVKF